MIGTTCSRPVRRQVWIMTSLRVAVISRDQSVRLAAARAFDGAPASWEVELHEAPPADADVVVYGPDVASNSGIRFDVDHPARVLEEVAAVASRAQSLRVVVTGPAGGVGATSVALHLAQAAAASHPACFVDLDLEWGAAERMGFSEGDFLTWAGAGESAESLRLAALPAPGGFRALLAPTSKPHTDVSTVLEATGDEFARVVVDCPGGRCRADVLRSADAAVLVMSPTVPGARRARAFLDSFPSTRWAIVTNRLGPGGETTRTVIQSILQRRLAMELPCAPALRDAEDAGRLLTSSWSRWKRAVDRLWKTLDQV